MKQAKVFTWPAIAAAILFLFVLLIPNLQFIGIEYKFKINNAEFRHDEGCSYITNIPNRPPGYPFTKFVSDTLGNPQASRLTLTENANPFGQSHSNHNDIRALGQGKYSHWYEGLFFSTSNCTNPALQDDVYEVTIPVTLATWVKIAWLIACMLLLAAIAKIAQTNYTVNRYCGFILQNLYIFFAPQSENRSKFLLKLILILVVTAPIIFLLITWFNGRSISLAVGGFFQVSDSLAYWTCANSLLDLGNFGNETSPTHEWCQRRSIYPSFLSGITFFSGRNIYLTLALQAALVSVSIFLFIRKCLPYAGIAGAIICFALLFIYASSTLFPLTLTENAGLIFGCISLTLLLRSAENRSLFLLAFGIAFMSIALNARAGAFFVLPFLVIWAGISAYLLKESVWRWVFVALAAVLAGFILQSLLVYGVGGNPSNSHGNFSYTLYGLTVGGKGWSQVLIDHPEIGLGDAAKSKVIYALAWRNFVENPVMFFTGLSKNVSLFILSGTYGFEKLGSLSIFAKTLWWISWVPLLKNAKKPAYLLIILLSLGVVLSMPLLIGDGGSRLFAATVAVDVLQIGIGFTWLVMVIFKLFPIVGSHFKKELIGNNKISLPLLEPVFAVGLLLLIILPFTPIRLLSAQKLPSFESCPSAENTVITKLDKATMYLEYSDEINASRFKGIVDRDDILSGLPSTAWFYDDLQQFNGKMLVAAYQFDLTDKYAPGPYLMTSDVPLSAEYYGRFVRLCIDKSKEEIIFGNPYRKLNSITLLD